MKQWVGLFLLIAVAGAVAVSGLAANSSTATVTVTWRILPFQSLTVVGSATPETSVISRFNLKQPTAADFAAGYIEQDGALTLVAASNIPWTVNVHALEPNMGTSTDGSYVKPLSDFLVRANGGTFIPISQFDQPLAHGQRGAYRLTIDYRVKLNPVAYKPGDYGLTVVYTITGD